MTTPRERLTILHTNDMHGRLDGMARVATLVQAAKRADPDVLYFDAGDIEETNAPLSSLTKGVAMHRLMNVAGCDAASSSAAFFQAAAPPPPRAGSGGPAATPAPHRRRQVRGPPG